jgi:phage major head subunit gpT-like protein
MIFTPQTLVDLQKGFSALFEKAKTDANFVIFAEQEAEMVSTPGIETNVYGWMAEMPIFKKILGPRSAARLAARSYSLKNEDYAFAYAVSKNDIKYDRLGIYRSHFTQAGKAARVWKDQMLEVARRAGKTALCYDGQFFYDTDHPKNMDDSGAGTFANLRTTFDLTGDNVADQYAVMATLADENGEILGFAPNVLECNSKLRAKAHAAVQNAWEIKVFGSNTAAAPRDNVNKGLVEVRINDRLEDNVWYLQHELMIKPFVVQTESEPSSLEMRVDPTDPHVWEHNEFLFGSRATGAAGYTYPHASSRCEI